MASDLLQAANQCPVRTRPSQWEVPVGMGREQFQAMGTTITLLLPLNLLAPGSQLVRELFAQWEATLSRFCPESELSRLNARAGQSVKVSGLLLHVVRAALSAAAETQGLFDPTLLSQLQQMGYKRSFEQLPANVPVSTEPVQAGGAWRGINISYLHKRITLPQGTSIDLGGIAKGMAVDAALRQLRLPGAHAALVNAGGDLAVMGLPAGYESWPLAIEGRNTGWVIPFQYGALATSGISRRHWQQGEHARHHIIDPRSGASSQSGLWSVTVAGGTCEQAEVAAKVAFLLGAEQGPAFLRQRGLAGLLVRPDGTWISAGPWPSEHMQAIAE